MLANDLASFTWPGWDEAGISPTEADVATGKVNWRSPLAKALIGAKVGDTVKWRRPAGETELEIIEIQYPRS